MKLYDGGASPNPRRVRIFLAEKGLIVPIIPVKLMELEHKTADFQRLNPHKSLPVLELDSGEVITESIAICRYFELLHPEPPLFGTGILGQVRVEMWQRRIELGLMAPVATVYRHTRRSMAMLEVPQIAEWAAANVPRVYEFLDLLDAHLKGRRFVLGDAFTVADITGLVAMDLMDWAKLTVPESLTEVLRWHAALKARPSAAA